MNNQYLGTAIVSWLTFLHLTVSQVRPPNFSPDALPDTAFSCEDKVTGGYYADLEADCQLFHVCVQVSEYEFQDFHFLCPNDTVFDQQHLVCTNWFEVDCHTQLAFFTNHWGIKSKGDDDVDSVAAEDVNDKTFLGQNPPLNRLRSGGRGQIETLRSRPGISRFPDYYDYDEDDDARVGGPSHDDTPSRHNIVHPPITTTPIPLGFTVTARTNKHQRNRGDFLNEDDGDVATIDPFDRPPKNNLRGRRPRVKSDIKIKFANSRKKFNKAEKKFKTTGSRKVKLNRKDRKKIEFVEPEEDNEPIRSPFTGPQLRPDGRSPRVKANIIAELQNKGPAETTTIEPFVEAFLASPSTISPIFFTGSPSPDPFGSGSTLRPFFAPTVKSSGVSPLSHAPLTFPISDISFSDLQIPSTGLIPPQDTREQGTNNIHETENKRFVSRPSPNRFNNRRKISARGRNRVVVTSTENKPFVEQVGNNNQTDESVETVDVNLPTRKPRPGLIPARQKPHVKSDVVLSKRNRGKKFSRVRAGIGHQQRDCSNPFNCPPTQRAPGGRARVKSNVRAKTRNFWHKPLKKRVKHRGKFSKEFGVGTSGARRNGIRRRKGRKQVAAPLENDISNDIEDNIQDDMEATQQTLETIPAQFVPTPRPLIGKENKDTFNGRDLFDEEDIFEQDLFFASSTVSSVVFKGSPTPSFGFFSSPKPRFNDIGSHVDLGAKKHEGKNSVFISSTLSNKIFIGSREEETTKPTLFLKPVEDVAVTVEPGIGGASSTTSSTTKRSFPSFPVRSKPPVKPNFNRPSFSRKKNKEAEKPPANELLSQILSVLDPAPKEEASEDTFIPTVSSETTSTTTKILETQAPRRESRFPLRRGRGPRVKSNLLFNKKNRPNRRKFGVKKDLFTTTTIASPSTTAPSTTTTITLVETSSDDLETSAPTNHAKEPEPTRASNPTTLEDLLLVTNPRRKASKRFFNRQRDTFFSNNKRGQSGILRSPFKKEEIKRKPPKNGVSLDSKTAETTQLESATDEMTNEGITEEIPKEVATEIMAKASTTEIMPKEIVFNESDILSVESLLDDDEEDENGNNDVTVTNSAKPAGGQFLTKFGFPNRRSRPRVKTALFGKKARKVGDNGIRVEFKKADIPSESSGIEDSSSEKPKFRVRPDGRKPRVKSNIRAKLSNSRKPSRTKTRVTFFKPNKHSFVEPAEPLSIVEAEDDKEVPISIESITEKEVGRPLEENSDNESDDQIQGETVNNTDFVEPQVSLTPPAPSERRPRVKSNIRAGLSNRRNRGSFPFKRSLKSSLLQSINFGNVGAVKDISSLFSKNRKHKQIEDIPISLQEIPSSPQNSPSRPQDPNSVLLQFVKNKNKEVEKVISTTAVPIPEFTITSISSTVHEKLSAFRALHKQTKTSNINNATPTVEAATNANVRKRKRKVRQEKFSNYDYQYYEEFHHSPDLDLV